MTQFPLSWNWNSIIKCDHLLEPLAQKCSQINCNRPLIIIFINCTSPTTKCPMSMCSQLKISRKPLTFKYLLSCLWLLDQRAEYSFKEQLDKINKKGLCYDSLSLLSLFKFVFEQTEVNHSQDRWTLPLALYYHVVYHLTSYHVNITGIVSIYTEFPFVPMNVHIGLMNIFFIHRSQRSNCAVFSWNIEPDIKISVLIAFIHWTRLAQIRISKAILFSHSDTKAFVVRKNHKNVEIAKNVPLSLHCHCTFSKISPRSL